MKVWNYAASVFLCSKLMLLEFHNNLISSFSGVVLYKLEV